jgi:magnesium-transporting ATPase (P-type)
MAIELMGNIVAILFNLLGTIYMAKGLLSLEPAELLRSYPPYTAVRHSLEAMRSVVGHRIETSKGIIFIIIAVIIQVSILLMSNIYKTQILSILQIIGGVIVIIGLAVFIHFVTPWYTNMKVLEVNKLFVKNEINKLKSMPLSERQYIISCADDYFSMRPREDETTPQFIKRIAEYVGANDPYYNDDNADDNALEKVLM